MAANTVALPQLTDDFASALDYVHKPEIFRKLVGQYPNQRDLSFLKEMSAYEKVGQTSFTWNEENRLLPPISIANKSTILANTKVRITLSTEDHYKSGTLSNVRIGDILEFKGGAKGFVIDKSTAVANAHTIDVQSLNSTYNVVSAAVVGDQVGIYSMAFVEGGQGYTESIAPIFTPYTNKVQIFREDFVVTSSEEGNISWMEFDMPANSLNPGEKGGFYYIKAKGDSYDRFLLKEELGLLTNDIDDGTLYTTANSSTAVRTTRGFIPHIQKYSELMDYGIKPTMGTFETMIRLINKNFGNRENMLLVGLNFNLGLKDFAVDIGKNGSVIYNTSEGKKMDMISLGFNAYEIAGYKFHVKQMNAFNHADTTGLSGFKYSDLAVLCPMDSRAGQDSNGEEKMMKPLSIRYKPMKGAGAREFHKVWPTGGNSTAGTDSYLLNRLHMASEKGTQVFGAKRFIYCSKAS